MSTVNGWTKEFPTETGIYWMRLDGETFLVPVHVIADRGVWYKEKLYTRSESMVGGREFLGPTSPADFEQLAALREVAKQARDWLAWWVESDGADIPDGVPSTPDILAALREALGDK